MKDIIFDPPTKFNFKCADYVPFRDRELCEKLRQLSGKELERRDPWHHPEFNIRVMMNPHPVLIATLFTRLKEASEAGRTFSMILGNPEPDTYIPPCPAHQLLPGRLLEGSHLRHGRMGRRYGQYRSGDL